MATEEYFKSVEDLAAEAEGTLGATPERLEDIGRFVARTRAMAAEFYRKSVEMRRVGRKPGRVAFTLPRLGGPQRVPDEDIMDYEDTPYYYARLELFADAEGNITRGDGKFALTDKGFAILYSGLQEASSLPEDYRKLEGRDVRDWRGIDLWRANYEDAALSGGLLVKAIQEAMAAALLEQAKGYLPLDGASAGDAEEDEDR